MARACRKEDRIMLRGTPIGDEGVRGADRYPVSLERKMRDFFLWSIKSIKLDRRKMRRNWENLWHDLNFLMYVEGRN